MKVGGYNIQSVHAGRLALDGGAMFGVVPKPLWSKKIEPDSRNRIPLATRCLLIEGQGRLILVDNGVGHKNDERFRDIYGVDYSHDDLIPNLKRLGYSPSDVTDVILTHLHFDHCGGTTYRDQGEIRLTCPRATHHVQRAHWAWAVASNPREKASFLKENFLPVASEGLLNLIDGDVELFDRVRVRVVNGHTTGQQIVRIGDGDEPGAWYAADLIPTRAHIRPVWGMAYDLDPLAAIQEKSDFLDLAERQGDILIFEHDHEIEACTLERTDRGIQAKNDVRLTDA